jgi:hypothetical protein
VERGVVGLKSDPISPTPPPPPAMAFVLHGTGIGESFKATSPDLAALEVCLKGATFVYSHQSARLAA